MRGTQSRLRNAVRRLRHEKIEDTELEQSAYTATRQYHNAIRYQKKQYWGNFVAKQDNIWKVAKLLEPERVTSFARVPSLIRADKFVTEGEDQKASELLETFYPPLPDVIAEEPEVATMFPAEDPNITLEEVKRKVFSTKPWKAPGRDSLPAIVWRQLWPILQEEILDQFKASLDEEILPRQWRKTKIIPLKKPSKPDYRYAKAWRPISLLATLGKIFEAVLAERISYVAERYNLLPENHFGARSRRSAEQALIPLQESIYTSWRRGQVLSLISFDVKGAYNGVYAPRLIQRLRARRTPERWLRWIKAFCTDRSASLTLNGRESDVRPILFPGLPQGSPLSPVLFSSTMPTWWQRGFQIERARLHSSTITLHGW